MRSVAVYACVALTVAAAFDFGGIVAGSEPSNESEAMRRAVPVIAALDKFRRDTGRYPSKLDELMPRYLHDRAELRYSANHVFKYSSAEGQYLLEFLLRGPHGGPSTAFSRVYLSDQKKWHYWGPY